MLSHSKSNLIIHHQVSGLETNCYLLYDPESREAAIIDVGGPIDELLSTIQNENLDLRYFLLTHAGLDHVIGLPDIRGDFPKALTCLHRLEFQNLQEHDAWADKWSKEVLGEEILAEWVKNPEFKKIMDFDVSVIDPPDLFVEDNQILELGKHQIRALHCPGHSPGGLCFAVDNILFSGDVLFKGSVGRVDIHNSSRDDQIISVRRLYKEFEDATLVYPGHMEPTTIGAERVGNQKVSETVVNL